MWGSNARDTHPIFFHHVLKALRNGARSYVVDPRGRILAEASEDRDELVVADLDMDMVREVRNLWQFFRDRRPELYSDLTEI